MQNQLEYYPRTANGLLRLFDSMGYKGRGVLTGLYERDENLPDS